MSTTTTASEDTVKKRTNSSLIKTGDVFTRFSSGTIVAVDLNRVELKNSDGKQWTIDRSIVEAEFAIASQVQGDEVRMNRSELIELIKQNPRNAMTISYVKKADGKKAAKELAEGKKDRTDRAWQIIVNRAMKGEDRELCGFHTLNFTPHSRLYFHCFGDTTGIRQVDLRTINEVIVNNTRYLLKTS